MNHPEMRNTVFGEVLAELIDARDLPVTPANVGVFAEAAGLDGWAVINRMASADAEPPGHLDGLIPALDLSEEEQKELAYAYAFERRLDLPADG